MGQDHHLANSMGLFLQKTNIIRDYLEDIVQGREFWPKEVCVYVGGWVTEGLQYRPKHSDESVVLTSSYTLLIYYWQAWSQFADELTDFRHHGNIHQAVQCLNLLITNALQHVPDVLQYMFRIQDQSVFNFCAIPQVPIPTSWSTCSCSVALASFPGLPTVHGFCSMQKLDCGKVWEQG